MALKSGEEVSVQSRFWKLRYLASALLIIFSTILGEAWLEALGHRGLSLFFIAAIVCIGAVFGQNAALFGALLAFASYKYFLVEPLHTFAMHPPDVLALITFLLTGLLVGGLAGRLSDRARAATERAQELVALLNASKDFAEAIEPRDAANRSEKHLALHGVSATITLHGASAGQERGQGEARDGAIIAPLRTARGEVATASLQPSAQQQNKSQEFTAALLEIAAISIDRAQLLSEITQARVVSEREGLRTALLSSLSHDLRTPIATILASASRLAEKQARDDDAFRIELGAAIQEEAERLNRYIANLLEMTRLQSGAIDLRRATVDPREVAEAVIERMRGRLGGRTLLKQYESGNALILVDPVLLEQALLNLFENAIEHGGEAASIIVGMQRTDEKLELFVEDNGPGVPASEQSVMFEKFFRGKSARANAGGVGLGLSVVRGIVEAFDGGVKIISPVTNGRGSRIVMEFPIMQGGSV